MNRRHYRVYVADEHTQKTPLHLAALDYFSFRTFRIPNTYVRPRIPHSQQQSSVHAVITVVHRDGQASCCGQGIVVPINFLFSFSRTTVGARTRGVYVCQLWRREDALSVCLLWAQWVSCPRIQKDARTAGLFGDRWLDLDSRARDFRTPTLYTFPAVLVSNYAYFCLLCAFRLFCDYSECLSFLEARARALVASLGAFWFSKSRVEMQEINDQVLAGTPVIRGETKPRNYGELETESKTASKLFLFWA